MKLLMEAEEAKLYDLENGYYVAQEHCSWIHQGYRLMIRPMDDCYLPSIFSSYRAFSGFGTRDNNVFTDL